MRKQPLDRQFGAWSYSSELFWRKVRKSTQGCWLWLGSRGDPGALFGCHKQQTDGKFYPQMTQARRVMYAEHTGEWPKPKQAIYHTCHNNMCVNPEHFTLIRGSEDSPFRNYRDEVCEAVN